MLLGLILSVWVVTGCFTEAQRVQKGRLPDLSYELKLSMNPRVNSGPDLGPPISNPILGDPGSSRFRGHLK